METENEKMAYLRQLQGGFGKIEKRRGPGSDGGRSDLTYERHRGKPHRSGRHGADWDARSETQSDWSAPRSHRSHSSYRSGRGSSSAYPPPPPAYDRRGSDNRGYDAYPEPYALRDRDRHSSGSSYGRHMQITPANERPGLASSDLALAQSDLEAKLKSAQRKVEEVLEQSHAQEVRARHAESALKESEAKTGGSEMKYQLMAEIVNIRDRCMELDKMKAEEEKKAMQMEETLRYEETRREEAERTLRDIETERNELSSHVEKLRMQAELLEEEKTKRNADTVKLQREKEMVEIERDETLELLERAVRQKEDLKRGKQNETQKAATELERVRLEQEREQQEVRKLLTNVDHLLAKFNRAGLPTDSSSSSTNDLIGIRDSVRRLVKANVSDGDKKR